MTKFESNSPAALLEAPSRSEPVAESDGIEVTEGPVLADLDEESLTASFSDHRVLSRQEEVELARAMRDAAARGDDAAARMHRDRFLAHNTGLVWEIANRYAFKGVERQDIFQYGMLGCAKALDRWDPDSGNKFSTYAFVTIKRTIDRALTDEGHTIRIPAHNGKILERLAGSVTPPDVEELARLTDSTPNKVRDTIAARAKIESLGGYNDPQAEKLEGREVSLLRLLGESEELDNLREAMNILSPDTRELIDLRFGLTSGKPMTLKECGEQLGISRHIATRKLDEGLLAIRRAMAA